VSWFRTRLRKHPQRTCNQLRNIVANATPKSMLYCSILINHHRRPDMVRAWGRARRGREEQARREAWLVAYGARGKTSLCYHVMIGGGWEPAPRYTLRRPKGRRQKQSLQGPKRGQAFRCRARKAGPARHTSTKPHTRPTRKHTTRTTHKEPTVPEGTRARRHTECANTHLSVEREGEEAECAINYLINY
jgi:hypothetical protein